MSTVRLLSIQIPRFWEHIKYALSQVERFGNDDKALGVYNRIFASLLNDKSQCFIMQEDVNTIKALLITEIIEDIITCTRILNIRCLYAFKVISNDEWSTDFEVVKQVAKSENCSKIVFQTSNNRIEQIGKLIGFNYKSTNMEMEV